MDCRLLPSTDNSVVSTGFLKWDFSIKTLFKFQALVASVRKMVSVSSYVHLSFVLLAVASFSFSKAEIMAVRYEHSVDDVPFNDLEIQLSDLNLRRARLYAVTELSPSLDRPRFKLPPFGRPRPTPKLPPFGRPTPKLPPFGQPVPGFKPPGRRFPPFSLFVPPPPHHKH